MQEKIFFEMFDNTGLISTFISVFRIPKCQSHYPVPTAYYD